MLLDISPSTQLIIAAILAVALILFIASNINDKLKLKVKEYEATWKAKESELKTQMQSWALGELEKYKNSELLLAKTQLEKNAIEAAITSLDRWKLEQESIIRADAIKRSMTVNLGKITEHLLPFSEEFKEFNPKDARFIGSPIDLIVFDGVSDRKEMVNIYMIEVKTGNSALTEAQRRIWQAVEAKRIFWKQIKMGEFKWKTEQ
ncbi:MAG: Holliday junction resolvase [Bacteroidetes bacterium]|nr:MAG: Holliday junction resolvase [Bacteroidota bacterium]